MRRANRSGAKMKIGVAVLSLAGLSAVVSGQDNPSANQALAPSVGLEIGQLELQRNSRIELSQVPYPNSKILYLEAIQERVPVFEGNFRITQDVIVTSFKTGDVVRSLVSRS